MRQGQNSKRSRGRGSGRRTNVPTRHQTFDSNGPSVRIRGNAYQVYEKYLAMARDATASGDRITAENFLQHAEHYFRIINADGEGDSRGRGAAQKAEQQRNGQATAEGDGEAAEAVVEKVVTPAGNGADSGEAAGEGEQPVVEFPNGEGGQPEGEEAPAPRKARAPRTPRAPRAQRARSRRSADDSDGADAAPQQPED
jgi:hypothetical protein